MDWWWPLVVVALPVVISVVIWDEDHPEESMKNALGVACIVVLFVIVGQFVKGE